MNTPVSVVIVSTPHARPRELEALRLIEQRRGITAAELAAALG